MVTVAELEAAAHFAELLRRVEGGEQVTITRDGAPVAVLAPARDVACADPSTAIAALKEARAGIQIDDATIRAWIAEGRR